MQNSKTQKLIGKYCEYLDRLIQIWEEESTGCNETWRIARKADFYAALLQLDNDCFVRYAEWSDIPFRKEQEQKEFDQWEESLNRPKKDQLTKPKTRIERLNEIRNKAKAIKAEITDIEEGSRLQGELAPEKLNKLLSSLESMQEIYDLNAKSGELDLLGKRANKLIVEMGLYSKWWRMALATHLVYETKLPYAETCESCNGLVNEISASMIDGRYGVYYSDADKRKLVNWVARTKTLLSRLKNKNVPKSISPEVEPITVDEDKQLVYDGQKWHRITPKALEILKKLNEKPGLGFTGEQLKSCPGSEERPDKTINKLPESVRARIVNTSGYGYHLI